MDRPRHVGTAALGRPSSEARPFAVAVIWMRISPLPSLAYYRRIFRAYLGGGKSHLTFWHESPAENPNATSDALGEYYMLFAEKADYQGFYDSAGIPQLDYHGKIGLQYNPIAIAQYGLGNFNLFRRTADPERRRKFFIIADWLCAHLEQNPQGLAVWNHHFDWEYRDTLRGPWYSALAQGQGISVLVRAYKESGEARYLDAAQRALACFHVPISDGGVAFTDESGDLWFEEYIVSPSTHILNGFIWASWGIYDYSLATQDASTQDLFSRAAGRCCIISTATTWDSGPCTNNRARACPWWRALSITSCTSSSCA